MTTTNITFRINTPNVVQETIEGEVVIVHLKKGDYYSLLDTGADIWAAIERGMSLEAIIGYTIDRYEGEKETITAGVEELIRQLREEEIIVPVENGDSLTPPPLSLPESETKRPFTAPNLSKYTDMEELLALDPIHDVDETGWPNTKIETLI